MLQAYLRQVINASQYSFAGLRRAFRTEKAFQLEVYTLPAITLLLLVLQPGAGWSAAAIIGWLAVMAAELLNSSLEEAFDLISLERNEHIKDGKDMASAAIFVMCAGNGFLWVCLLYHVFTE
ncbi:hypothetical protein FACS1894206_02090 [Deltaproteobacteria bacterium]|nr:hypothetical protein FACS1894206_02090 [Deltaproteobacteria bacterium]